MKTKNQISILTLAVTISGCSFLPSVGPDYEEPKMAAPDAWSAKVEGDTKVQSPIELATWWKTLGDEKLNLSLIHI